MMGLARSCGESMLGGSMGPISFAVIVPLSALVAVAVLLARRRAIWQTTLISAWCWAIAALMIWAAVELCGFGWVSGNRLASLRLVALAMSAAPFVALVGAKRPQHLA